MRAFQCVLILGLGFLAGAGAVFGLAEEQIGPNSNRRFAVTEQNFWPKGLVDLLDRESRVYSLWVNGNNRFYFDAGPREVSEILTIFSRIRMRDPVVTLKAGKPMVKTFKEQEPSSSFFRMMLGASRVSPAPRPDRHGS